MKVFVSRPEIREGDLSLWHRFYGAAPSAFVDIETTGLNRMADCVYLVGLLFEDEEGPVELQYLAENAGDERALLQAVGEKLRQFRTLISYNGDAFDLPFLSLRAQKLRLKSFPELSGSADLLREYRPLAKLFGWPDRRQKTLERFLGIDREDPFTGGQLIELFDEYSATGDARLEQVLLLHNYEDVADMPALLRVKGLVEQLRTACVTDAGTLREGGLCLTLSEPMLLSAELKPDGCLVRTEAGCRELTLRFDRCTEELRYYLPDYRNYYFLPETAQLVHRSAADGIPATARRAARREECCLSREGSFLFFPPCQAEALAGLPETQKPLHFFRRDLHEKDVFLEEEEFARFLTQASKESISTWIRSMI